MRAPVADPFNVYPERRPTLHQFCKQRDKCKGPGCRAKGRTWPRKAFKAPYSTRPSPEHFRPVIALPRRVVDLLPARQVIALWELRTQLMEERYRQREERENARYDREFDKPGERPFVPDASDIDPDEF